ncbi:Predicted membrane protein [Enterobacter kobei]|nr:Predicted membrane protein [Enterobacter kobei]
MDELYILGCLLLVFALVVAPVLAVIGFNRSTAARQEIARLRQRIEALEQRGAAEIAPETAQTAAPVVVTAPVVEHTPAPVDPWRPDASVPRAEPAPVSAPAPAAKQPSAFGGILTSLVRWFMQGNPLAKLGILLLFLGLSFLLRYTVEHSLFPLELRLVATALFAIILLAIGWRLRHKQPVYALILQGGATGILYLTVFGAFRLWQMLPMTLAFALLVAICAASVGLAVLQKALSLAMLASLGGYLAPLLLSTGGGNFVALFSFYLLLSIGILAISVWQHWRELNLLGLLFTFGVGGLWGLNDYQPEHYWVCQLFLIANTLIFGVLCVALSLRAQEKGKQIIDGVLLFAPPLIGFGMQYGMTRHWEYGPALSALGYGAFYLSLAFLALRRYPSIGRPLVMAALAIGGGFATLAIPLALSARWTAMAWALEGLGILWLGMQQNQRRMSYSGTALLVLALGSALWAQMDGVTSLSLLLIFAILSLCWLAAAWLWRKSVLPVSWALSAGGLLFWIVALLGASQRVLKQELPVLAGVLALSAVSVWGWRQAAARLAWRELDASKWLLWPLMLVMVVYQLSHQQIVAAGWSNLAWCIALPAALMLLRRDGERLLPRVAMGLHLTLCWMILLALAAELYWFARALPWGMAAWGSGLAMAAGGGVILALSAAVRRRAWPFGEWPALYTCLAPIPVVVALLVLLVVTNFQDGVVYRQTWLPLVNPLEEGAAFALLGLVVFYRAVDRYYPALLAQARPWPAVAIMAFGFWWLNGALMRALAWYGDVAWNMASLWDSRLIQTTFALFWMLIALVAMVHATRRASRQEWLCGAALLGVVMVKLMLVDSAGGGGLSRAVAFIGVAILVLIVGYFSPLPPKTGDEK